MGSRRVLSGIVFALVLLTFLPPAAEASVGPRPRARVGIAGAPVASTRHAAAVPVVACATAYGVRLPLPKLPKKEELSLPATLIGRVELYTDTRGQMRLLAPSGWDCHATIGADGSEELVIYPKNEAATAAKGAASLAQAVVGSETSACMICELSQACTLFIHAAMALQRVYPNVPCPAQPVGLTTEVKSQTEISFVDPPKVRGPGVPSGGANPAYGAMTYPAGTAQANDGSWMETCTLGTLRATCQASLQYFSAWYGMR
jgi:hypothetical protein